ncbi:carbohydrate ABC transporter permease [Prosthecomicrobium sp. N25]|uniref:carbohydrate ABC transporter permease n=1 Tax=Prosthecomicrobium sp. N25 TaxID=3129254 RepID=UPI0030783188
MRSRAGEFLDRTFPTWSLAPAAIIFIVLSVYPILNLLHMSVSTFRTVDGVDRATFDPLANLRFFATDPVLKAAIVNTLIFVAVSVAIELLIGLALAIQVARLRRGKGLIRTLMILPILVPPVAIGSMWKLILNYDFGVLNQGLALVGLGPVNWLGDQTLALVSVIIVDVWHWVPFIFLILFAAVEGLPVDVMEAAKIDGATDRQVTWHVMLPLLKPAISVAFIFRAILAFKAFDEVFLLTGGGPGTSSELISLHLYKIFFVQNNVGYGAMLSITMILMVVAFLLVARQATASGAGDRP